ncbi:Protein C7orf10, putative [Perkinsus marinus ATCC 50983]|uniref:Protein C7orf10, putative n=1 Tax=Perkinsus marinus (strain ATCC 50983 / TXsc) TaxID=423536 RepID=C5K4N8_PERM5|nr:Protein C7orf10, putative [Perkinsus marinus ATCC 50983]EER20310.1 Protein C7orf10, putative [Perkinsus marinus ATCC 50983]|eukprot:XP_002788514.1 Protein C7orf10, putative [Perkinsus marinus ATCC 50983]
MLTTNRIPIVFEQRRTSPITLWRGFSSSTAPLPLHGVRVIDLTRILAGPYGGMMLADYGAEVIKVEKPGVGDDARAWGPPFTHKGRESAYFIAPNRNKHSIGVNLKTPEGQQIIKDLVKVSDIVIENYVPGTLAKYGLDYESLRKFNPALVYGSLTGYGDTGPDKDRPGYALMVEGRCGMMACTGIGDQPVKIGVAWTDILAGLHLHGGVLAALYNAKVTGQGRHVKCSLLESQVSAMANVASGYLIGGVECARMGTQHPNIVPYGAFPTADGHIVAGALNDAQWKSFCNVLGRPDLEEDEKFKTNEARCNHRDELNGILNEILKTKRTEEWMALLDVLPHKERLAHDKLQNMQGVFSDPQVLARGMKLTVEHATAGPIDVVGPAVKFEPAPLKGEKSLPPPALGEHTKWVLQKCLGYSDEKIARLAEDRIVHIMTNEPL